MEEKIRNLIEGTIVDAGYSLSDVKIEKEGTVLFLRVFIDKQDIVLRYNSNRHTVTNAINELIDNGIIIRCDYYKNQYNINTKVFIKF